MIHLHGFLPETNTSTGGQNSASTLHPSELANFRGALSEAVSSTLEKFGVNSNDVKISITHADAAAANPVEINTTNTGSTPVRTTPPVPGNTSDTPSSSSSAGSSPTGSSSTNNSDDPNLYALFGGSSGSASSAPTSEPAAPSSSTAVDPQQAFDNNYWASQPAAVQALRTMQDPEQRTALATQLASEGYSIDVPIMVWGWDPSIVTSMRQADGYTWVPSALQNPVEVAPGLSAVGSLAAYDPKNPPAGSIMVS